MNYPDLYERLRKRYPHVGAAWMQKACMDAETRANELDRLPDEMRQVLVALTVHFTFADDYARAGIRHSMRALAAPYYPEGVPP